MTFITFEGGEGTGKTTVVRQVVEIMNQYKSDGLAVTREVVAVNDPGGCPSASKIRKILLTGEQDEFLGATELLLFTAARYELVNRVIRPHLEADRIVISDRFTDSTRVYQTRGNKISPVLVEETISAFTDGLRPTFSILLDAPVEVTLPRAKARSGPETRFEDMDISVHQEIRNKFLRLFGAKNKATYAIVDVTQPLEKVVEQCVSIIVSRAI